MKKYFLSALTLALTLTLSSCGMGGGQSLIAGGTTPATTTTTGLGSFLGGETAQGTLGHLLSGILGGKTTASTLEGTWKYDGPSVKFESENILSQVGGAVMSSKLESMMGKQLTKMGMTQGYSTMTFTKDGNYTLTLKGKTYTGTYSLSGDQMTLTGAFGMTHQTCTATVSAGTLYMLFDASALMNIATKVSAANSTLSSLVGNYKGVKMGWKAVKN